MKQLLQNMRDGQTRVVDVPAPITRPGMALVRTGASLVSAGTERMVVEFAEKNLLEKARSRPDLVRQVLNKARREGLRPTVQAAFSRLDQPLALGYSSAGTIVECGLGLEGFHAGERVACAGGGYAVHAEYGVVPHNLMAKLPDAVDFEEGAFATLGAIALQGLRLAELQLGERVAIIGLGLLGLLSAGLARAAGCTVFGVDLNPGRLKLAEEYGVQAVLRPDAEQAGAAATQGRGFDAVLICADTASDDPVELAGVLARDRARVVAVGAVGFRLPRKIYYEKELQFIVSRSYGPGRYDPAYEEGGQDYPLGYVRWTEGRNLQAVVDLIGAGKLDVRPLISHRFPIEQAADAYELITGKTEQPFLGVLLTYPQAVAHTADAPTRRVDLAVGGAIAAGEVRLGVLGAGNYASATFFPTVKRVGRAQRIGIASASGLTARSAADKFGFQFATSEEAQIFGDPQVNLVAILTRHNHHARQAVEGLRLGKHVFCEKPLAIHEDDLKVVEQALGEPGHPLLTVGFNRRYAPLALRLREFLQGRSEPMVAHYRVNAGYLPLNHWLHDPQVGGGRIIGEGCHFIDFLTFLTGQLPVTVQAAALDDLGRYRQDNVVLTFTYPDGSLGILSYLANGDKSVAKEYVEIFCGGSTALLDDFRSLELARSGRKQVVRGGMAQDKGHAGLWQAFLDAVSSGGDTPIPYGDLVGVTRASFAAQAAVVEGRTMPVDGSERGD